MVTLTLALLLSAPLPARAGGSTATWSLEASTLTYHVTHSLHRVEGASHSARGKGACLEGACEFLIAVPVDSFDSGDSNRDLHMIQTVRGAEHKLVVVRTKLPESSLDKPELAVELAIEFAGSTATYHNVRLHRTGREGEARLTGTIPLNIADFKIDPPSLLSMPIKVDVPVDVDLTWRRR